MIPVIQIAKFVWREERAALWRGLLLSVAVLVAGAALLGLSGWFITAAGAAGVAGIGIAFDVFRPSAGVRFLALGRTAARYGERVLTHDATLRVLARLRVRLLARLADEPPETLARLRSPALLNRVTADVDALDGVAIRLVFPLVAGAITLALAAIALSWLVSSLVAAVVVGSLAAGGVLAMWGLGRASILPAAEAEAARQDLRNAAVEHVRARIVLAFSGTLELSRAHLVTIENRSRRAELRLARLDRHAAAVVSLAGIIAASGALVVGGTLALNGQISPAVAAIAVFASLALIEILVPVQRAVAEIGRMRDAASRVAPMLEDVPADHSASARRAAPDQTAPSLLRLVDLTFAAPGGATPLSAPVNMSVDAGETVALMGRSGTGKTTLLSTIAGLYSPLSGAVEIQGQPVDALGEAALRTALGFLPQRSSLVSGTIRDNLRLAAPDVSDVEMSEVLAALGLGEVLAARDGLDTTLGEGGSGLSGGESRRLALARVLLRRPEVVLLDEPTEGLDSDTADQVLASIRRLLPRTAIVTATHKTAEVSACDRVVHLKGTF